MKEYKSNEELIQYLSNKGVIISNKDYALNKIEKYTYYSIINTYKFVFKKDDGNYLSNVSFEEIYALFVFDKNLKIIFLKYCLEIETVIKFLMANQISQKYGIQKYLSVDNLDLGIKENIRQNLVDKINKEIKKEYNTHTAVTHYMDKYGFVPPFVLVKLNY